MAIRQSKTAKWREFVSSFDHRTDAAKLWRTIKALDNKTSKQRRNQPIKFKGKKRKKTFTSAKDLAHRFNKQFTTPRPHTTSQAYRTITKSIQNRSLEDHPTITTTQVIKALKKAKNSKATGPDGITMIHLKHLGPKAIEHLTSTFNLSISRSQIPAIWKTSIIIPLLKPGKPANESASYRPISLLCPAVKILEKCLLPILQKHLKTAEHQHGFRPRHSTVTALNELSTVITDGFNQRKPAARTVLVALDLSKAFDTVCHATLLKLINDSTLPGALVRWLATYLHGRQARTLFRDTVSSSRIVRFGVPQGSVVAPTLFNFYVADAPMPPPTIFLVSYADDFTVFALGTDIETLSKDINSYLTTLCNFLDSRDLEISTPKCSVTLFTPSTKEHKITPDVKINGKALILAKTPKILGVTFDTALTFGPHCKLAAARGRSRVNILKALAGTTWGQSKETLIVAYQAFIRPVLEYASPVWTPIAAQTHVETLQKVQNSALRVATGCTTMTAIQHLHDETKILPVRRHIRMKAVQHQLAHHLEGHPGNRLLDRPEPPRNMKETLFSRYERYITALLETSDSEEDDDTHVTEEDYRGLLKKVHTNEVKDALDNRDNNKVLDEPAPKLSKDELRLPRGTRRTLAQLRSGYSPFLQSYLHRLDESTPETCPQCNSETHTTGHLFRCSANPTTITPHALWENPIEAAAFLQLDTEEATNEGQEEGQTTGT